MMQTDLDPEVAASQQRERAEAIGQRLQSLADNRVSQKASLEQRWIEDTRQHVGEYAPDVIIPNGRSRAFIGETRNKCNQAESRLAERVLPTESRNWSLSETPVQDDSEKLLQLMREAGAPAEVIAALMAQAKPDAQSPDEQAKQKAARDKMLKMQTLIDDQMSEAGYNAVMRGVIRDAVILGTGVVRAPALRNVTSKRYREQSGLQVMVKESAIKPGIERISPWDFFPDWAPCIEKAENVLVRHRMTRKEVRGLPKLPGFSGEAVAELLERDADLQTSGLVDNLRSVEQRQHEKRYEVWEFVGCLPADDLRALGLDDLPAGAGEPSAIIWFCQGIVLKAVLYPYDDEELPFAVFNWERDDHSLFGFGVPFVCRNSQRVANSAWRLVLDNGGLAAVPPYVYDAQAIRPADGDPTLTPGKAFVTTGQQTRLPTPIMTLNIPIQADLLFAILDRARQLMDAETGMRDLMNVEGGSPLVTKTATGAAMLMSSMDAPLLHRVRQFDEQITARVLTAIYRWNMQFHDDESVKGDYNVLPMGSVSMVLKEQQLASWLQMVQMFAQIPMFAQNVNWPELQRQLVKMAELNADNVLKDEKDQQQEAQQQGPTPEQQIAQMDAQLKQAELQLKEAKLQMDAMLKQAELQLKQQDMEGKQQLAENQQQLDALKVQQAAEDSRNDLQRDVIRLQDNREQRQMDAALKQAEIQNDQQIAASEIEADMRNNALKLDSENRRFNTEVLLKQTQGSGI